MRKTGLFRPLSYPKRAPLPKERCSFFCVFGRKVPLQRCPCGGNGVQPGGTWRRCGKARRQVRGESEWRGQLVEKTRVRRRGEWVCEKAAGHLVEEMRVLRERGWGSEEQRGQLAEMNAKFAQLHPKRGIKIASERHNRRRCHAPHSPPCESQSHREAEGWESAHRASRACGDNARKRNEGAGRPDRRPRFRHNGTSPDRAHTSTVPCRPPHGAPNGARQRWKARETPCCAPSCPNAPRSRPTKGRNPPPPARAAPADVPRWDECRGARVFLLREWS